MGLVPSTAVPPITVLTDAERLSDEYDPVAGTVVATASGIRTIEIEAIIERHGQVPLRAATERAFRAAFVIVSAAPASDATLNEVANWSAIFGDRMDDPNLPSFADLTGGRATLDTTLGPRRPRSDPPPDMPPEARCDPFTHSGCRNPDTSCYLGGQRTLCALSRGFERGEACESSFDCAPGLECLRRQSSEEAVCSPLCDPDDAASPIACETLCDDYFRVSVLDGELTVGRCVVP
jgi:hypothetical protein